MKGVHVLRHVSPRLTTGPGVVAAIALGMLFAGPRPALAIPIPIGFISWDVTIPGATGQFDIANETAANSSGDPTFPVMTPVGLRNLALDVSLSDGTMRHFGAADFILNPFDGLSVEGPVIAIGGQNPRPVQARLTGTFLPLNFTLFDNSMWTTAPGFSALVTNGGAPLVDGDLALVFADAALISTRLPDIPEPGTLLLTISGLLVVLAGRATKWRDRRTAPRRRAGGAARPLVFILGLTLAAASTVTAQVRMNVSAQPSAGIGGSSTVNAIGSAFPAGTGTIDASNITVSLATSCGGPVVATAVATSARVATGNQYRVGFTLPGTLIAGNYYITLAGITSGGTSFASAPDSCSEVHVTHADPVLAACTQSGPLAIRANPTGGSVTAYAPNGCWDDACTQTGVQKVALEGDGAPTTIPTPQVVSLCATNPVTNKTVCLGDTDVYVIENDAVTATLHSASDGQGRISGGLCNNCGIAIDPVTNRAVISIGLTYSAAQPFRSGLQFLDLNTNTFSPPFKSADYVAEHISIDPLRGYILSPNEQGNYNLFGYSTGGVASEFSNHLAGFRELDSPAEDCSTGIALGALENVFGGVFVADLTQATFTPGTPGTWAAMQQIVTLSDVPFEPTGVAVAQGSHLGILTPEYTAGGAFAVIRLPDASGAGTPTIVDYAVGTIPGFAGTPDPHSVSTYTSPNDGRAYGVVASGFPPTALARIDLACVLELPRNAGKHTTSRSSECITIRNTGNVPAGPPTIASTPLTSAVAGREYVYNVKAVDPHNFVLTYSLPAAPEGMVVNPANGQIQWSPEVNQAGAHAVTVMARNPEGLTGTQSFQVIVTVVPNRPPVITSFPVIVATVGQLYSYQLHATDPDNRPLTYALLSWPEGMSIVPQTGLIQWTPTLNQARPAAVTVLVQNDRGLSSSQSFKIFVPVPQNQPPVITSTAVTSATVGVLYVYQLRAADPNDDPIAYSFVAVPFGMTIDSVTGLIHWTPTSDDVGDWSVTLRAQDPSRSVATQSFHLQVQRAYPVPTIAVISPAPNSTLGKPVDVVATISDPSPGDPPVSWQVDLARGDGTARTVASGTGAIAGGTVARIDPTLIRDDSYSLVITVSRLGQVDRQSFDYSVLSGNLKLGNFKTSFTDIAIPVAGIPMVITRVYDSLDTGPGEFGAGWRLGLPGQVTDSARETPLEPFTRRTRVYVTRPDGRRVGFTFRPLKPSPFPIWLPGFSPDPGVTDTLSVEPTDLDDALGNFYEFLGGPYTREPTR